MLEEANAYSAESQLFRLSAPTLVVAGSRDTFIPPAQSKALARRLPNSEYVEFGGGTHVCPLEFPDELYATTKKFLDRIDGSS
jgi:pimeloyl-ACP methyl ester carboxylesterase